MLGNRGPNLSTSGGRKGEQLFESIDKAQPVDYTLVMVCSPVLVGANERVEPCHSHKVDMVLHNHHVSNVVLTVQTPGSIGDYQGRHPKQFHHSHWHRQLKKMKRRFKTIDYFQCHNSNCCELFQQAVTNDSSSC